MCELMISLPSGSNEQNPKVACELRHPSTPPPFPWCPSPLLFFFSAFPYLVYWVQLDLALHSNNGGLRSLGEDHHSGAAAVGLGHA